MQWYMVIAMPAMMSWMAAKFPAFLCIYWLSITFIGILQQIVVTKPVKVRMEKRQQELAEERRKQLSEQQNIRGAKAQARANREMRRHNKEAKEENAAEEASDTEVRQHAPRQHRRRTRK